MSADKFLIEGCLAAIADILCFPQAISNKKKFRDSSFQKIQISLLLFLLLVVKLELSLNFQRMKFREWYEE